MKTFQLKNEFIELNKLLKLLGLVETGGQANLIITDGEVRVNGEVEFQKRKKLRTGDVVVFEDVKIKIE